MSTAVVIGAGPAGLMAAELMANAGLSVLIAEQKPSVGRKFLMAGKSGLNLTKAEDPQLFSRAYGDRHAEMEPMIREFGPADVAAWAQSLGQDVFTGSSGRVFPKSMKASPLLRAWLARLNAAGVELKTRWRWERFTDEGILFHTPDGHQELSADVVVLAMGGASWARLGSDGAWADRLPDPISEFRPSNMGFKVKWSAHMQDQIGTPLKNLGFVLDDQVVRGEAVISERGLEGGGVYAVSSAVRDGAPLVLDLLPDLTMADVAMRLSKTRGKTSLSNHMRKVLGLSPVKITLLNEFARPLPTDANALAGLIKGLAIPHDGPRPLDEAISTAGGVRFEDLTEDLMLKNKPGVFVAGEMLDWEAPTGGYLITGCLATGRRAAQGAIAWCKAHTE